MRGNDDCHPLSIAAEPLAYDGMKARCDQRCLLYTSSFQCTYCSSIGVILIPTGSSKISLIPSFQPDKKPQAAGGEARRRQIDNEPNFLLTRVKRGKNL